MQLLKLCISQCRIYGIAGAGNEGAFASPYFRASCIGEARLVVDPGEGEEEVGGDTRYPIRRRRGCGAAGGSKIHLFSYFKKRRQ